MSTAVLKSGWFLVLLACGTISHAAGGETIETATVIPALPFADGGNTCGNQNDYDVACPYSDSVSPDVVYAYTPDVDMIVDIDLCESTYDTKLYVFAGGPDDVVACNDDCWCCEHGEWISRIWPLSLPSGTTYFIVVDGWGSSCGDYVLHVSGEPAPVPVRGLTWGQVKSRYRMK